jgi:hypothetical protein
MTSRKLQVSKVLIEQSCGVHISVSLFLVFVASLMMSRFGASNFNHKLSIGPAFANRNAQVYSPLSNA